MRDEFRITLGLPVILRCRIASESASSSSMSLRWKGSHWWPLMIVSIPVVFRAKFRTELVHCASRLAPTWSRWPCVLSAMIGLSVNCSTNFRRSASPSPVSMTAARSVPMIRPICCVCAPRRSPSQTCNGNHHTGFQPGPNSSLGWGVRIEPLPQASAAAGQYLSHPQHVRSGCGGSITAFGKVDGRGESLGMVTTPQRSKLSRQTLTARAGGCYKPIS